MRFYTHQHRFYCGIDLHARSMFVCIMDQSGEIRHCLGRSPRTGKISRWRWSASSPGTGLPICAAIHGGKTKNDKIDSHKIAALLRSGMLPMAYVYPQGMRSTRDLLRRRLYLARQHAELQTHIQNTNTQVPEHDPVAVHLLRTIPGVGKTLALVILYEIHDINRFPKVGNFVSYARLVKCAHESAGKRKTGTNNKIGNAHLKWAFSEAACLFLRRNERGKLFHQRLVSRYGKAKAMSIIAQKLGRTVYTMLKRRTPYDARRFFETLT